MLLWHGDRGKVRRGYIDQGVCPKTHKILDDVDRTDLSDLGWIEH